LDTSRRIGLLRSVWRMMRSWMIAGVLAVVLLLAFVFGTWAYQARRPSIPSNCFITEDGSEICGSINGSA
jgi:hypothetical protein